MVSFLDIKENKAHASAIFIILPLTIVSFFFYTKYNYTDWNLTVKIVTGGLAWGIHRGKASEYLSCRTAQKDIRVFYDPCGGKNAGMKSGKVKV